MPELPEVETIRRQLAPLVQGRVLARLDVRDERWCRACRTWHAPPPAVAPPPALALVPALDPDRQEPR